MMRKGALLCAALSLGPLAFGACDPASEGPPPEEGEIDPGALGGAANGTFQAGPLSQAELEELRDASCVSHREQANPFPSTIEFVIDVSGSMALSPNLGTESKWEITQNALRRAAMTLPPSTKLGAVLYPAQRTERNCTTVEGPCEPGPELDSSACVNVDAMLPIRRWGGEASDQRAAFSEALEAVNPVGGTPTFDAFDLALAELEASDEGREQFVVLLTDGQPTFDKGCTGAGNVDQPVDEEPIIAAIEKARESGILTFIVGSPGSEEVSGSLEDARPWLSRAAIAGGTAPDGCTEESEDFCHFDLTEETDFNDGLQEALDRILGQIKSCDFPIPDAPGEQKLDPHAVNVILLPSESSGLVVGQADAASEDQPCEEGWEYSKAKDSVSLCPASCEEYRRSALTSAELLFGCEPAPVIPPT